MRYLLIPVCTLMCGCGVSLTTSGFKAGVITEEIREENGSRVSTEDVTGIKIQWAPDFSWNDVTEWVTGKRK